MAPSASTSSPSKAHKGAPTTPKAAKRSKAVAKTPQKLSLKRPAASVSAASPKKASSSSKTKTTPKKQSKSCFHPEALASSFVLGDLGAPAFEGRARLDAAAPKKARLLSIKLADGGEGKQPMLTVSYRGQAPKVLEDKVRLLSLAQMHEVLRQIGLRCSTSRRRAARPPLSAEAVAARSPGLWWSLVMLSLGWTEDQGAAFKIDGPVAVGSNVADLLATLVDAACPEQSEDES